MTLLHDFNEFAAVCRELDSSALSFTTSGRVSSARAVRELAASQLADRETAEALAIYMREVGSYALLTPSEEMELARRIQQGDAAARERMICANLRLVIRIAQHYEGLGLPLLDLISEGNIGLMTAVDRFDPAKGAKLSNYSSLWIKQSMRRALSGQSKTIRLPVNATDKLYQLRKAARKLEELLHREPTDAELASEVGLGEARVAELRTATIHPLSLDAPLSEADSSNLGDILPDDEAMTPAATMEKAGLLGAVRQLISQLNSREQLILRHHFGLDGSREMTLEALGGKFGVTRERIRQLEAGALVKLRAMLAQLDSPNRQAKATFKTGAVLQVNRRSNPRQALRSGDNSRKIAPAGPAVESDAAGFAPVKRNNMLTTVRPVRVTADGGAPSRKSKGVRLDVASIYDVQRLLSARRSELRESSEQGHEQSALESLPFAPKSSRNSRRRPAAQLGDSANANMGRVRRVA